MPVYLRNTTKFTPDSLQNFNPKEDDFDDFIQDPDLFLDRLPQPYRMIDKLCNHILETAWEVIVQREEKRHVEASKIRPPKYTSDVQIEVHGFTKSLCSSPEGDFIFLGCPDGLSVICAISQDTIDEWKDDKMDVVDVSVYAIDESSCLITTVDDMGVGRLFLFSESNIYLMYAFNEPTVILESFSTGDTSINKKVEKSIPTQSNTMMGVTKKDKPIITKCEASKKGDYIGVCFQNIHTQEHWLDVYKVNKEALQKELESANAKFAKKSETHLNSNVVTSDSRPTSAMTDTSENRNDNGENEGTEKKETPQSQKSSDKKTQKFTAPQVILKVRPPSPVTGMNLASPFGAQKSVDDTGDVLGTGTKHLLSNHHLEAKRAVFEHLHSDLLPYLPQETNPSVLEPTFHFLNPGRLLPNGLDQLSLDGQPTSILVWWEGQYQMMVYSLTKLSSKDVELKPDMVWPLSSSITYSTVTPDCTLLAIALSNNNVVVWDLHLGLFRRIVHVSDKGEIFKLIFLDPSLYPSSEEMNFGSTRPYKLGTNCYLLVVFDDGQMWRVACGLNETSPPENVMSNSDQWESHTVVEPLIGIPELVVTCRRNGQVFIEDVMTGAVVLEISLIEPFSVFTPWQPVFAVGGKGKVLFIKGQAADAQESREASVVDGTSNETVVETKTEQQSLFVFKLRSLRTLDSYRDKTRNSDNSFSLHTTVEDRTNAVFKQRMSQQADRTARMQQRWSQLKEDLEMIKQLREKTIKRGAPRAYTHLSTGY